MCLKYQINKLDKVLTKRFKNKCTKILFTRFELKYIGFRMNRQGVPLQDKVQAI